MEHRTETINRIATVLAIVALAALLASGSTLAQQVYRWVDEDGNTQYSESLPPGHKDTGHDLLNERGIVISEDQHLTPEQVEEIKPEEQDEAEELGELPRDSSGLPRPKPLYSEAQKQIKMDNFLMLRYESKQEITDAMNVEIKQLNYDRRLLEGSRDSMNESYRGQIRVAANKQRSGQSVSEEDAHRMEYLRVKLADNAQKISELERREQDIRNTFRIQLERYQYLLDKYPKDSPD